MKLNLFTILLFFSIQGQNINVNNDYEYNLIRFLILNNEINSNYSLNIRPLDVNNISNNYNVNYKTILKKKIIKYY